MREESDSRSDSREADRVRRRKRRGKKEEGERARSKVKGSKQEEKESGMRRNEKRGREVNSEMPLFRNAPAGGSLAEVFRRRTAHFRLINSLSDDFACSETM